MKQFAYTHESRDRTLSIDRARAECGDQGSKSFASGAGQIGLDFFDDGQGGAEQLMQFFFGLLHL